jgi:protein-S-isoprenylcysteine O-methyltransferase Ste14
MNRPASRAISDSSVSRGAVLLFATISYALFLGVLVYAVAFVSNMYVPFAIDFGRTSEAFGTAISINLALLGLFAVQHSVMARPAFKRWWTRFIPKPIERSTFVLLTSLVLILLFWQWRPMPDLIWSTTSDVIATVLIVLFWLGWGIAAVATFQIDHFDLFGMRQAILFYRGRPYTRLPFKKRGLYRYVRHPIMLGFLVAFWATPDMTEGHLLLAMVVTLYILIAVQLEERDLVAEHGKLYEDYQDSVPMLIPINFEGDDEFDSEPGAG